MVTNLGGRGQELYDGLYCQRGEMENRIKEQQLDLFADRTFYLYDTFAGLPEEWSSELERTQANPGYTWDGGASIAA